MKVHTPARPLRRFCPFLVVSAAILAAPAADNGPPAPLKLAFEDAELGSEPDGFLVIDGEMTVVEVEGGRALQIAPFPLTEAGAVLGPNLGADATIEAKVRADSKRRSHPRCGIGIHGMSGFRLRVVPAAKEIELLRDEEAVATAPFEPSGTGWMHLKLELAPEGEAKWTVRATVWEAGNDPPEEPQITHSTDRAPGTGKASIWGTPYAGLPIFFDDIVITSGGTAE